MKKSRTRKLEKIYAALFRYFGPQHWWPGDTPFEIMVGAVLTQNTNWENVRRAIDNIKAARALDPDVLLDMPDARLAALIRPSGYFNVKARRLKNLLGFVRDRFGGKIENMQPVATAQLREMLLGVNGCGAETVDSILLYALDKTTFVVDAYTKRFMFRHGLLATPDAPYPEVKALFEEHLVPDRALYNEYHALIVALGKHFCKPRPRCRECPLRRFARVQDFPPVK